MAENSRRAYKIFSITLVVLALVWQHIQATRLGYKVEHLRRQSRIVKSRLACLQVELETSLSPAELARQAKNSLGMIPAAPQSLRILNTPAESAGRRPILSRLLPKSWRSALPT